jgi:MFS family permease
MGSALQPDLFCAASHSIMVGYSVGGMFPSYLQKDLGLPTGYVALPIVLQSLMFFLSAMFRGWCADRFGRRMTLMTTSLLTISVAPLYLLTNGLHDGRGVLHPAGLLWRRHTHAMAPLSVRALPDESQMLVSPVAGRELRHRAAQLLCLKFCAQALPNAG